VKVDGSVPYAIYSPSVAGLNADLDLVNLDDKRIRYDCRISKNLQCTPDVNKSKLAIRLQRSVKPGDLSFLFIQHAAERLMIATPVINIGTVVFVETPKSNPPTKMSDSGFPEKR